MLITFLGVISEVSWFLPFTIAKFANRTLNMNGNEGDQDKIQSNNGQLDKLDMIKKLRDLPDEKLKEVLELVKKNASKNEKPKDE